MNSIPLKGDPNADTVALGCFRESPFSASTAPPTGGGAFVGATKCLSLTLSSRNGTFSRFIFFPYLAMTAYPSYSDAL